MASQQAHLHPSETLTGGHPGMGHHHHPGSSQGGLVHGNPVHAAHTDIPAHLQMHAAGNAHTRRNYATLIGLNFSHEVYFLSLGEKAFRGARVFQRVCDSSFVLKSYFCMQCNSK